VTPLAAVGVLVGHALAYALTGVDPGPVHHYLQHAPQVLVILAPVGLLGLACQQRGGTPSLAPFALLGLAGFTVQEHVERLAHTGEVPWLLTSPTFLLGLALQLPVALACLLLARVVIGAIGARPRARRAPGAAPWLPLAVTPVLSPAGRRPLRATGRGPPATAVP
jgi:hypothetical protein